MAIHQTPQLTVDMDACPATAPLTFPNQTLLGAQFAFDNDLALLMGIFSQVFVRLMASEAVDVDGSGRDPIPGQRGALKVLSRSGI